MNSWERLAALLVLVFVVVLVVFQLGGAAEAITAWAPLAAAVASAAAAIIASQSLRHQVDRANREQREATKESARVRVARQIDLLMKFWDEFNSEAFRIARRDAAQVLRDKHYLNTPQRPDFDAVTPRVNNFFENMGFLVKTEALDAELVWEKFDAWVPMYWHLSKPIIENDRESAKSPWLSSDFEYLADQMELVRERKSTEYGVPFRSFDNPTDDEVHMFLAAEIQHR